MSKARITSYQPYNALEGLDLGVELLVPAIKLKIFVNEEDGPLTDWHTLIVCDKPFSLLPNPCVAVGMDCRH